MNMNPSYDTWKTTNTEEDAPDCPKCEDGYLSFHRAKGYACWECWECGWDSEVA